MRYPNDAILSIPNIFEIRDSDIKKFIMLYNINVFDSKNNTDDRFNHIIGIRDMFIDMNISRIPAIVLHQYFDLTYGLIGFLSIEGYYIALTNVYNSKLEIVDFKVEKFIDTKRKEMTNIITGHNININDLFNPKEDQPTLPSNNIKSFKLGRMYSETYDDTTETVSLGIKDNASGSFAWVVPFIKDSLKRININKKEDKSLKKEIRIPILVFKHIENNLYKIENRVYSKTPDKKVKIYDFYNIVKLCYSLRRSENIYIESVSLKDDIDSKGFRKDLLVVDITRVVGYINNIEFTIDKDEIVVTGVITKNDEIDDIENYTLTPVLVIKPDGVIIEGLHNMNEDDYTYKILRIPKIMIDIKI